MIAALIFVCSVAALLQFFISYCRSALIATSREPLSIQARDVTGLVGMTACGEEFRLYMELLQLCPDRPDDRRIVRAVRVYYRMVSGLRSVMSRLAPKVSSWAETERSRCAYFAAVMLDRHIAYNRTLAAEQANE
jgi:hypothetical protein